MSSAMMPFQTADEIEAAEAAEAAAKTGSAGTPTLTGKAAKVRELHSSPANGYKTVTLRTNDKLKRMMKEYCRWTETELDEDDPFFETTMTDIFLTGLEVHFQKWEDNK